MPNTTVNRDNGARQPRQTPGQGVDPKLIAPFGFAIVDCFKRMLGVEVTLGRPCVWDQCGPPFDVCGIVGYSGDISGNVILSFHAATARGLVEKFAGFPIDPGSSDYADGIGEFANWIMGAAKSKLGGIVVMSCPAVIMGSSQKVARLSDVPCIAIPCKCQFGDFAIDINVKRS